MERKPLIHYDTIKEIGGKKYYLGEITDEAGTHSIWIEESKAKDMPQRK